MRKRNKKYDFPQQQGRTRWVMRSDSHANAVKRYKLSHGLNGGDVVRVKMNTIKIKYN